MGYCICCLFSGHLGMAQEKTTLPPLPVLTHSIDAYFLTRTDIQISELTQSKKYRWLAYLPNPGYSPFVGGFNLSLNLAAPLQEIRLSHTTRQRVKYLQRINTADADALKNEVTVEYYALQYLLEAHTKKTRLDSLENLATQLVERKYQKNELTPSQYIAEMKAHELFLVTRRREENEIRQAMHTLFLKAKMDVATNNAHLYFDHP